MAPTCCLSPSITPPPFLEALRHHELLGELSFQEILAFVFRASSLRRDIMLPQVCSVPDDVPPDLLPPSIHEFLSTSTRLSATMVDVCWSAFREVIWTMPTLSELDIQHRQSFQDHASITLYPPHTHCTRADCPSAQTQLPLKKEESCQVVLHTLHGIIPAWSVHLTCRTCGTIYQNNFSISANRRWYYDGVPDYIQVSDHHFVDCKVANLWTELHLKSHVSAQACALIYDSALSAKEELVLEEAGWRFGFKLKNEHVWDAFLVLALTADCKQQGVCLDVPNGGFQNRRFCEAMRA
ncbi:hypothetical protein BD769DRAFT_1360062, partial [Suillus cothurnatus]